MNKSIYFLFGMAASLIFLLSFLPKAVAADNGYMDETYRPQVHYTAEKNMINDPNGLIYYKGVWHLFHQYNIFDAVHWGHATSTDLVHWTPQQPALAPDGVGQIFSGTTVVDTDYTSGFQTGTEKVLVAVFTYGEHNGGPQSQGIAYSNDAGNSWTMYSGNPVIPNSGQNDFRDPKVFWYAPEHKWVMVLTGGTHLEFWSSPNLKQWTKMSNWGATEGCHGGNWETPDLFQLPIDGNAANMKWVLSTGVDGNGPNGNVASQYVIGTFNGTTFINDNSSSTCLWQNYGKDFYAAQTWNNVPDSDGRRLMIAWADNWQYRFDPPTTPFNGQLSLIRELKLKTLAEGVRLTETPIKEYEGLRGTPQTWTNQTVTPTTNLLSGINGDNLEIVAEFQADMATANEFGIKVRKGASQSTVVGYDKTNSYMFVDRTKSGLIPNPTGLNPNTYWSGKHTAPLTQVNGKIILHIFVDRSSVEVFGNDREGISDLIFPDRNSLGLETYAIGGNVTVNSLTVYPLNRAWSASSPFTSTNLSGWTTVQGEWADTINGKEGSADNDGLVLASQRGSDFTYSAEIKIKGINSGNPKPIKQEAAGGLVFRANETATEGYVVNVNAKTDNVNLIKYNGNGLSVTLASYSTTLNTNTTYNLKVTASGSNIKVYLNQTLVIETNDSTYRSGIVGLNVWNAVADFNQVIYSNTTNFSTNINGWTSQSGSWTYQANGLQGSSTGDAFFISADSASDFIYQADFTIGSTEGQRAGTLVFRSNADASQAYAVNVDAGADVITFFKWGNGGGVISSYSTVINTNTTYRLKVKALGSSFTIYVNDVPVINATDSTYSSGKLGLNVYHSTTMIQNAFVYRKPNTWNAVSGTWTEITDGKQGIAAGDGFDMSTQTADNFTYEADVAISGSSGGKGAAALIFRANNTATQGYVVNLDAQNDAVTLFKYNGDGTSTVIKRYYYSFDTDRAYHLMVKTNIDQIQVYLNSEKIIDASDSSFASGLLGLNVWNSQSSITNITYTPSLSTNMAGWSPLTGSWTNLPDGVQGSSAGDAFYMSAETAKDFIYQADFTIGSTGGQRAGTLVFRSNDDASQAYAVNVDAGADIITFFKWGSGGGVISSYNTTINMNTTYLLKVTALGSSFSIYLNDALIMTAVDAAYSNGKLGLNVYNSTSTIQNVHVYRKLNAWNNVSGTWTDIPGGKQGTASGDGFIMSTETVGNFSYEADVNISGVAGGDGAAALMFRANSTATQGYVTNVDALNDRITLFKFNGDGSAATIKVYITDINTNSTYHIAVKAIDNHFEVYLNGNKIIDALDSSFSSGLLGLNVWNSQSPFTNITFTPILNQVLNSDFEYGDIHGWTEWHPAGQSGAYGVDGNDVYKGIYKLYFWSAVPYQQSVHQLIGNLPNGTYVVSGWVKLNKSAAASRMEVSNYGGAQINVNIVQGNAYQFISSTLNVTNGQLDIGFYVNDVFGNTSLQIDHVSVIKQ